MDDENWSNLHKIYSQKDWAKLPSIFATQAIRYFPPSGSLLDLGAGIGQDSIYFAENRYDVTATDLLVETLSQNIIQRTHQHITVEPVDLRKKLLYDDATFNVVYAHLSLHYFDHQTTEQIFSEVYRVLKPGGVFALFTNATTDPEYGTGVEIEPDYFLIDGVAKRYFSKESIGVYLHDFETILIDSDGETYKDREIGVHNLIRVICRKPS